MRRTRFRDYGLRRALALARRVDEDPRGTDRRRKTQAGSAPHPAKSRRATRRRGRILRRDEAQIPEGSPEILQSLGASTDMVWPWQAAALAGRGAQIRTQAGRIPDPRSRGISPGQSSAAPALLTRANRRSMLRRRGRNVRRHASSRHDAPVTDISGKSGLDAGDFDQQHIEEPDLGGERRRRRRARQQMELRISLLDRVQRVRTAQLTRSWEESPASRILNPLSLAGCVKGTNSNRCVRQMRLERPGKCHRIIAGDLICSKRRLL